MANSASRLLWVFLSLVLLPFATCVSTCNSVSVESYLCGNPNPGTTFCKAFASTSASNQATWPTWPGSSACTVPFLLSTSEKSQLHEQILLGCSSWQSNKSPKCLKKATTTTTTTSTVPTNTPSALNPSLPAAPTATLIPVLNLNNNLSSYDNLYPQRSGDLFYAEQSYQNDPYLTKLYAQMTVNFTYPTVVVENSYFLFDLNCTAGPNEGLKFLITDHTAFNIINTNWTQYQDMVLVLNNDQCRNISNNTRSYWLGHVSSASWTAEFGLNLGAITFDGDEILVEQGIQNASLQWGTRSTPTGSSVAANVKLNNTVLCNAPVVAPNVAPWVQPCIANFDNALDQKMGYHYTPTQDRQNNMNNLLVNGFAHPNIVVNIVAAAQAKRIKRNPAVPAPTARFDRRAPSAPAVTARARLEDMNEERSLDSIWGDITGGVKSVGGDIISGGEAIVNTVESGVAVATNALANAAGKVGAIASSEAAVVESALSQGFAEASSIAEQLSQSAASYASRLASAASQVEQQAASSIEAIGPQMSAWATGLATVIESTAETIAADVSEWDPSTHGQLNINLAPGKLKSSPWGPAYLLHSFGGSSKKKRSNSSTSKSSTGTPTKTSSPTSSTTKPSNTKKSVDVFCVNCGVKGVTDYSGSAEFSLQNGVTQLQFAMNGSLQFSIAIGLDAEFKYTMPQQTMNLIPPQGAPILEIEGVITIGPILELQATLNGDITAGGQILAGATMTIPQFSTNFDFVNTANSYARGFDNSTIQKFFAAAGEVGVEAIVGLPFSIGVGIAIPAVKFDKQIKVVNTPSITAQAEFAAGITLGSAAPNLTDQTCLNGINWAVTFDNELDLNFFGLKTWSLYNYAPPPLSEGCYHIPGLPTNEKRDVVDKRRGINEKLATPIHGSGSSIPIPTAVPNPKSSSKSSTRTTPVTTAKTSTKSTTKTTTKSASPSSSASSASGPFPSDNWKSVTYSSTGMSVSNNATSNSNTATSGINYGTQLHDVTGQLSVLSAGDGNLYLSRSKTGSFFERPVDASNAYVNSSAQASYATSLTLVQDAQARGMYIFPATMARWGVSRVRMLPINQVPLGAAQTVLSYGVMSPGTNATYFFVNGSSPVPAYYPVACQVTDATSTTHTKIFAVNLLSTGIQNLQDPTLRAYVTGGVVGKCTYLQLVGKAVANPNPTDPLSELTKYAGIFGLTGLLKGTGASSVTSTAASAALAGSLASIFGQIANHFGDH